MPRPWPGPQENGADLALQPGEQAADLVSRYAPMFFDPSFDPMVTNKTPGEGRDILSSSANNLYDGVTMADIDGFSERHPLNSRLVKQDGRLVEEVYRVGGRYHHAIARVVSHLRDAAAVAPDGIEGGARGADPRLRDG